MKSPLPYVAVVIIIALIGVAALLSPQSPQNQPGGSLIAMMPPNQKTLFEDEFNSLDTTKWQFSPNQTGTEIQAGSLVLSTYPDHNDGNLFALSGEFSVGENQRLIMEWQAMIQKDYQGRNEVWLTAPSHGVNENDYPLGAFGLTYTSPESTEKARGLHFEYVAGQFPVCQIKISPSIDPSQLTLYRIEWRKTQTRNWFTGYVNNFRIGNCDVPVTFQTAQIRIKSNVYGIVDESYTFARLNPIRPQSARYDWIRVWKIPIE